ncbi:MAG: outer membrane protein transport protein [Mariprofundaceae bacterium]
MKRIFFAWLAIFGLTATVNAAGFQMAELGAKATGMAGAFTAVADDASALWYNPAGIAFQAGGRVMLGADAIIARGRDFVLNANSQPGSSPTLTASRTHFPPHAYVSYYNEDWPVAFGIGINSPFLLSTEWPITASLADVNRFAEIYMVSFNPNVAVRINEHLAVAVGVSYFFVKDFTFINTAQHRDGDGGGYGGNIALLYKWQGWSFGTSYRSRVSVDVKGSAQTNITFPDQVSVGAAYRPLENLLFSLDVDWVNWQTFDTLTFGGPSPFSMNFNWDAAFNYRVGSEWEFQPDARVRIGYSYAPTPVNYSDFSPAVPDSNRHAVTLGYGHDFTDALSLDFAYMFIFLVEHNQFNSAVATINGTYQSNKLHVLSGAVSYKF